MKKNIFIASLLIISSLSISAQVNYPFLWDRGSSFTQQSTLFNDIDLSSYELVSANLSFTDKDQMQKVVLSPFRLANNTKRLQSLVNTKINFSLKEQITTFGIGFGGDNTSPYTRRATKIRNELFGHIPVPDNMPASSESVERLLAEILTCQEKDSCQHCIDENTLKIIHELDSIKQMQLKLDAFNKSNADINHRLDSLLLVYDKQVAKYSLKWTLGYNKQFFPNLFARGTANDFDSLNHFNSKADNISAAITFGYNNAQVLLTATYNQIYSRSGADKTQKVVPYYGPAFSASIRLFKFLKQSVLDTTASYKKSLFVPSLNLGLSFEGKYADGSAKYEAFYQDKLKKIIVWTPYFDILISPVLQFRIALPITRNTFVGDEKLVAAGANIQYNFKLSNLAQ